MHFAELKWLPQSCQSQATLHGRVQPFAAAARKPAKRHVADVGRAGVNEKLATGCILRAELELPKAYGRRHEKSVAEADRIRWRGQIESAEAVEPEPVEGLIETGTGDRFATASPSTRVLPCRHESSQATRDCRQMHEVRLPRAFVQGR